MPTVEAQQELNPSQAILQMLTGKWIAQAVSVAATLGVVIVTPDISLLTSALKSAGNPRCI